MFMMSIKTPANNFELFIVSTTVFSDFSIFLSTLTLYFYGAISCATRALFP